MTRLTALLFVALAASAACANPVRFDIDGQYRGGISLDFGRIGDVTLAFRPEPGGGMHVSGNGSVRHPRDRAKILQIGLDTTFRVEGSWVRIVNARNTANEHGKKLLEKIERILPFLHVAATAPASTQRHYYTKTGLLGMTTTQRGDAIEAVVEDGPRTLVTFYLTRDASGQALLHRFRVPTKDGAILNFVAARPLAFANLVARR